MLMAAFLLVNLIALHWNLRYKWIEFAKQALCFNVLVMALLENSLQFMLFSIINLINVR